jgi:hypothetical protein
MSPEDKIQQFVLIGRRHRMFWSQNVSPPKNYVRVRYNVREPIMEMIERRERAHIEALRQKLTSLLK